MVTHSSHSESEDHSLTEVFFSASAACAATEALFLPCPPRRGKGMDTCYSATYMSQTRDQQRFTISEVAADSHEPIWRRSALCGHPLPSLTDNWTHGAASRHTIAQISHTRPSLRSRSYYSFPSRFKLISFASQEYRTHFNEIRGK